MTDGKRPALKNKTLDARLFPARRDAGDGKDVPMEAIQALIVWAEEYGFDPWSGQVCYMYGVPYVTERGAVANAKRYPEYKGYDTRKLTAQAMVDMGYSEEDWGWTCEVWVEGYRRPVQEWGVVTREEVEHARHTFGERAGFLPLVKNPSGQARARAIRRAHLLAFPPERRRGE